MKTEYTDASSPISRQKLYIDALLVYLLLFVSGSWRYNLSPDRNLVAVFVFSFAAWYLFSDRKVNDRFVLYAVTFLGLLFALSLYTQGSLSPASAISTTMKLILAYLIIRTVAERFIDVYIQVVVFLAAFSLFGYFIDSFSLLGGVVSKLPRVGEMGYEGFFYLYSFPWHIDRNNSIFFEPGAYQAFLNSALFILFFVKNSFSPKLARIYILILMAALATTFSTTGFLIFLAMFPMFLYKSKVLGFTGKVKLVALGGVVVAVFAAQFYTSLVEKVSDYLTADEYDFGYSAQSRSAHSKADMKLFKKHIFGMGHKQYGEEFGIVSRTGEGTSSNGVTKTLAVFGLPFSVFIFGSYFLALKRLLDGYLLATIAFVMFVMFLAGESYYVSSPIGFAIIAAAFIARKIPQDVQPQHE